MYLAIVTVEILESSIWGLERSYQGNLICILQLKKVVRKQSIECLLVSQAFICVIFKFVR